MTVTQSRQVERYGSPAGPRSLTTHSWSRRRIAAALVRIGGLGLPMAAGCAVAVLASAGLPPAASTPGVVIRTLVVIAASMITIASADFGLRRFLPLATLFQLSLIFPDRAPSRVRLTVQASSKRRIAQMVEEARHNGLDRDPQRAAEQVIVMIGTIGEHDRRTRGHSERVRIYADLIGKELHLTTEERQKLQWAALLHDLGKIETPAAILNKTEPLTAHEWTVIHRHPEVGRRLMRPLSPLLGEWAEGVWNHHERWDGAGYPRGLEHERIGRAAAIIAVADAFEAMTSPRPYRKALTMAEARAEITEQAGSQFSPEAVRAFLSIGLRHLRFAMGPLSALSHVPFLQRAAQVPAQLHGALTSAVAAAPAIAAGTAVIAGLMTTGAIDTSPVIDDGSPVMAAEVDSPGEPPSTTAPPRAPRSSPPPLVSPTTAAPASTASTTSSTTTTSTSSTSTSSSTTRYGESTTTTSTASTTTRSEGSTSSTASTTTTSTSTTTSSTTTTSTSTSSSTSTTTSSSTTSTTSRPSGD